jgi:CRP-like cAMP-binding protein
MVPTMRPAASPLENKLLESLPQPERERVFALLNRVLLCRGDALYEPGAQLSRVYFPTSAVVSLTHVRDDGAIAEIAAIGSEGVVGVALILSRDSPLTRAVVQNSGCGYSLTGPLLKEECSRRGDTRRLLLRYAQTLVAQMAQAVICNRRHSAEQQFCRWLLLRLDRIGTRELAITREDLAETLGVSQESLTLTLGKLRALNLIQIEQDQIGIVDRVGVEARACECYSAVKRETERLRYGAITSSVGGMAAA